MTLLYQKTAETIALQIDNGSLQQGDKLPSIRQLSNQLKVSIGTIQQAYAELEDQELIIPRNRSGYYVNRPPRVPILCPSTPPLKREPSEVGIMETAISVIVTSSLPEMVPLGGANPNLDGAGVAQIHKLLGKHAHTVPPGYGNPQGYLPLRQHLARRSITAGKPYSADEIVITSGCQEAVTLALRCFTKPGDIIAVESPCYYGLLQAIELSGLKAVEVPVSEEKGFDLERLENLVEHWNVKGLLLNPTFSNPSGYSCSDEDKQAIVEMLEKHDMYLIEDDIYADLGWSETRPRSIHSFDQNGRVFLCSSFSKMLSHDLRVGWIVSGKHHQQVKNLKFIQTLGSPLLQQMAIADFLSTQRLERHIRWATREYQKRQRFLLKQLHQHFPPGTHATQPEGSFICWIELPLQVNGMRLYHDALEEKISITPGEIYSPTRQFKNYIRLNYAKASESQTEQAIQKLAELIQQQLAEK